MSITFARGTSNNVGLSAVLNTPNITVTGVKFKIPAHSGSATAYGYNAKKYPQRQFVTDMGFWGYYRANNNNIAQYSYDSGAIILNVGTSSGWSSGGTKSFTIPASSDIDTSLVFNANNKNSRTATLTAPGLNWSVLNEAIDSGSGTIAGSGSATITLNAPPTCTYTQVQSDTSDKFFKNKTTAKVSISSLSAKYGGDITECKLTIGSQTKTRVTDGDLEIKLNATGTFTPAVSLKDSRGQTTTYNLNPITVKDVPIYAKHSGTWKIAMPKIKTAGTWKDARSIYVKQGGTWKQIM